MPATSPDAIQKKKDQRQEQARAKREAVGKTFTPREAKQQRSNPNPNSEMERLTKKKEIMEIEKDILILKERRDEKKAEKEKGEKEKGETMEKATQNNGKQGKGNNKGGDKWSQEYRAYFRRERNAGRSPKAFQQHEEDKWGGPPPEAGESSRESTYRVYYTRATRGGDKATNFDDWWRHQDEVVSFENW
jgi:hypothetical protein